MTTNDDTLYNAAQPAGQAQEKTNSSWKVITLGSVSGVLLGAGSMYAATAYAQNKEAEQLNDLAEAHDADAINVSVAEVDDNQSFADAFNEAREAVGPNGVFQWHGGIYSTCTREEWESMSEQQRDAVTDQVHPEVHPEEIDTHNVTEQTPEIHVHVHQHGTATGNEQSDNVYTSHHQQDVHQVNNPEPEPSSDIKVLETGQVEGHDAAILDMNGDNEADILVVDINDNHELDGQDIYFDREGNYGTIDGTETYNVNDDVTPDNDPNMINTANPDVAPDMPDYTADMPDYVNDADTTGLV